MGKGVHYFFTNIYVVSVNVGMETKMNNLDYFNCILCGGKKYSMIGKKPRDRKESDIVVCKDCGHIQQFPLMSLEEEEEEYAQDLGVRFGKVKVAEGSDFASMRVKYSEWTQQHADMYWDKLQGHRNVLELASGYGFFCENLNLRADKKFNIEGVEISKFRLQNYVGGGTVHNINFSYEDVPDEMKKKYDLIICIHLLEHLRKPVEYLERIRPLIAEDGEVLFEVPNIDCFLGEISPKYKDFMYVMEHYSYYNKDTLKLTFEKAHYKNIKVYTKEIYSIENHCRWVREGKPFIKYNQMFLPDKRLEFINEEYKQRVSEMGKGFSLIVEANI